MVDKLAERLVRRSFVKTVLKRVVAFGFLVALVYGGVALVYATKTIFKVKKNYAVVLERFGGKREAITQVGWHVRLPFFTHIEQEVSLMNQILYLGGASEPVRIISSENVTLWTSGMLTYRIIDLQTWAIENLDPLNILQGDYDGIVKDILQARKVSQLISEREQIKEEIFEALKSRPINKGAPPLEKKYGIEVVSFVLKETRFGDKLVEASEEKKRRELIAEADNYAADQESSRIRKLYAAYLSGIGALRKELGGNERTDNALLQFLAQQQWANAYQKNQSGQQTVVIQNTGSAPGLTLLPPSQQTQAVAAGGGK